MARKPDAPCAGGCGRMLWGGHGSLPAGVRCCRDCRVAGRAPVPTKAPPVRPLRTCDESGCEDKHLARGMCRRHYRAWKWAQGGEQKNPTTVIGSMASLHGAYFPKPKPIKVRVAVGVLAYCPHCDSAMGATSAVLRCCPTCGTTAELNEEEVAWAISEKRSTAA